MAHQDMRRTTGNPKCSWVIARLCLWVADAHDYPAQNGEARSLSAAEHQKIQRHLDECATCRCHQAALEETLRVLACAADELASEPEAPSLWPILERRIVAESKHMQSRGQPAPFSSLGRWAHAWAIFAGGLPLRQAWARDSLYGTLTCWPRTLGASPALRFVVGLASAVSFLVVVFAISALYDQWAIVQATTNAIPLPNPILRQAWLADDPSELSDIPGDTESSMDQLAQAEPTHLPEAPISEAGSASPHRTALPLRIGYDLEHGTPAAPDAHDAKPAY